MKKILIFSLAYYPDVVSGAEVAIKEITNRIDPNDIEFHMVTLRFDSTLPKIEKIGNVLIYRIGFSRPNPTMADLRKFPLHLNKFLFQFTAAFKAMSLHREYHYDGIWAMMAHSAGVPAAIFKICNPKIGYVLTLQEGDPIPEIERTVRPLWPLFTRAFTRADVVQVISSFLGDWARIRGFTGPLELIPNGASLPPADYYSEADIKILKEKYCKKKGDVFIVTVSRLVEKNAVDDIIRALPLLHQNIKVLIVGGGPDEEALKQLANDLNVAERVKFTGQVDRKQTAECRMISDIFARPSRSEGMGNSFASAMASRIPIIATQEGGLIDFIFDAKHNPDKETTAWVVDRDSPDQIAEAVKDILTHPEQVKKVVSTAYKLVSEEYNWDFIARDMHEKVFKRLFAFNHTNL
ncbi:MAG: glycosyltransferase [Candidatus Yonathbacteria bacterium]|nr:glycosyltransferase [Candidatus Yonathbacteria bacterium]